MNTVAVERIEDGWLVGVKNSISGAMRRYFCPAPEVVNVARRALAGEI